MTPIYARIYKVDEASRTVTGRAVQEVVDRTGEIFDYASSVPFFRAWSAGVYEASHGASYGNLRAMHGNVAAGKLTDIEFNDAEKAIDVTAKIVDENEWTKCRDGVYHGFSIGGTYAKKWQDVVNGRLVTRYTAVPSELSIVDAPAVPTAKFFQVHKRDGRIVKRAFVNTPRLAFKDGTFELIQKGQPRSDLGRFGAGMTAADHEQAAADHASAAQKEMHMSTNIAARHSAAAHDHRQAATAIRLNAPDADLKSSKAQASTEWANKGAKHTVSLKANKSATAIQLTKSSVDVFRRIHAGGSQPLAGDFLRKYKRELVLAKDVRAIRKAISLPRESMNGTNGGAIANTGASNNWRDDPAPTIKPTLVGGQVTTDVSRSPNIDAVLDAIKQDLARGAKRMM